MREPRAQLLEVLQDRLGYRFRDPALLERALTHRSWANDGNRRDEHGVFDDNERLEYLGDAVWRMVVAECLYKTHPGADEGVLTKRRRHIVQGGHQTAIGRELGLADPGMMRTGRLPAEEARRGEASRVEDAFEALIGAVFLDAGYDATLALLVPMIEAADASFARSIEPKSSLQEALQGLGLPLPAYATVDEGGPGHVKWFECVVQVVTAPGEAPGEWGRARGGSKKKAQIAAAKVALEALVRAGVLAKPDDA